MHGRAITNMSVCTLQSLPSVDQSHVFQYNIVNNKGAKSLQLRFCVNERENERHFDMKIRSISLKGQQLNSLDLGL
jgi:hypothetical protein